MRRAAIAGLCAAIVLQAAPAWAEVSTYDGSDRKLYVRQVGADMSTFSIAWDKKGGSGRSFSGTVYQDVIYRGDVAITDQRFLELLEDADVARTFRRRCGERLGSRVRWAWIGLGLLAAGGVMAYIDMNPNNPAPTDPLLVVGGMGGLSLGAITLIGTGLEIQKRPFTTEEAIDAVAEYNKKIGRE